MGKDETSLSREMKIEGARRVLEKQMGETLPHFVLAGLSFRGDIATGYFVNPKKPSYVRIWEIRYDAARKTVYVETWREVMLVPMDGFLFPRDAVLVREEEELKGMGLDVSGRAEPDSAEAELRRQYRARLTAALCERHSAAMVKEALAWNENTRSFYIGMTEAYRTVLDIVSGRIEGAAR
jgi:hypothetical protein